MKKRTFKTTSLMVIMAMVVGIMLFAISQLSVSAAPTLVFQENFDNPSNNGYAWGTVGVNITATPVNGWFSDNTGTAAQRRPTNGINTSGGGYFMNGKYLAYNFSSALTGKDVILNVSMYGGTSTNGLNRGINVIIMDNATNIVSRIQFPTTTFNRGAVFNWEDVGGIPTLVGHEFTSNSYVDADYDWQTVKVVLKWDGSKYASAEYYFGSNTSPAGIPEGYSSLAKADATVIGRMQYSPANTNAYNIDNVSVYTEEVASTCTVSVNNGNGVTNGTVTSDPANATVNSGSTVTFTITPDAGYQIDTLTFDGANVSVNGSNQYTTPALSANKNLNVTFSKIPAAAPAINSAPAHKTNETVTVTPAGGGAPVDRVIPTSFIVYSTVSLDPTFYTLDSFGMYLKDSDGKVVTLPVVNKNGSGQFAVRVYSSYNGFVVGNTYKLQSFLNYTEDSIQKSITGVENEFIWE